MLLVNFVFSSVENVSHNVRNLTLFFARCCII